MALPESANLDDLTFQELVDQAKKLIPQYCPEWTDHNVSDPGITLIELFASMTEMLLYRVNKLPDKVYLKLLELVGLGLDAPRAAQAHVTFYLSKELSAGEQEQPIGAGAQVATIRTETALPIIFTTDAPLVIRPARLRQLILASATGQHTEQDQLREQLNGPPVALFSNTPQIDDALELAFEHNLGFHVLRIQIESQEAAGGGTSEHPPIEWQAWNDMGWITLSLGEVEDRSAGFNRSGTITLHLPTMSQTSRYGSNGYWLRCRVVSAREGQYPYLASPQIKRLSVATLGATVSAHHGVSVAGEQLGVSNGSPGQSFRLRHAPTLMFDTIEVVPPGKPASEIPTWTRVANFAESTPASRHFVLDSLSGVVTFGPLLPQPDGRNYRFGAVPPDGHTIRVPFYQYGGGEIGNVPAGALQVLKSSYPQVRAVTNRRPASQGANPQNLEAASVVVPAKLGLRTRAVTADDYEYLARQIAGVARARCLAPGDQSQSTKPGMPKPGQVRVVIVPTLPETEELPQSPLPLAAIQPPDELIERVQIELRRLSVLGVDVRVQRPVYRQVKVDVKISVAPGVGAEQRGEIERRVRGELYLSINPSDRPKRQGWPFGKGLADWELKALLGGLPGVERVVSLKLLCEQQEVEQVDLAPGELIYSGDHEIKIELAKNATP
ncbi:MAG TPA: putative baseplate assembly protein [Kouleothrix sp.]|nr:putative baseplate assembly protein [Kouleothrix sp.]